MAQPQQQPYADLGSSSVPEYYADPKAYEVIKKIGKGQFSTVFRARCVVDQTIVALKQIQIFEMADARARSDCLKEIDLLKHLKHPNIIQYLASFVHQNELYIVLELAAAGDLSQMITHFKRRQKLIAESTIWRYFVQICSALDHMHSQRVMHRDIKPANVFVTDQGQVKLGDLGLSRFFSQSTKVAHSLVGTPYYMSPERIRELPYDFASDVWSLGCLLYEMAALQSPFYAEGLTITDLCAKINRCEYPPLPGEVYSDEIRGLIRMCIKANAAERPQVKMIYQIALKMTAMMP